MRTAIWFIQLGTPNSTSVSDVRKYLIEFLSDGRVIDVPAFIRFVLVRGIIAPFRASKSAKAYREIWTNEGSPLRVYSERFLKGVKQEFSVSHDTKVHLSMRYGEPSMKSGLDEIMKDRPDRIIVVPLYPQYASATSGSVAEEAMRLFSELQGIPEVIITSTFYAEDFFINYFVRQLSSIKPDAETFFLFSYHGLPERQMLKLEGQACSFADCCLTQWPDNFLCYRHHCFETTKRVVSKLNLSPTQFATTFQSRLAGQPWIQPYTDSEIPKIQKRGFKRLVVACPSFTTDCLETLEEIGIRAASDWSEAGGKDFQFISCPNDDPEYIQGFSKWLTRLYGVRA